MKKFVCENLEELKEGFYDEPGEEERVPSEVRDAMYQAGKEGFEPQEKDYEHEFGVEEELLDYFLELLTETANYTDLKRDQVEKIFKKALDEVYREG